MTGAGFPRSGPLDSPGAGGPDTPVTGGGTWAARLAEPWLAAGADPGARSLADLLTDLTGAPADDELTGEAEFLRAFRQRVHPPRATGRRVHLLTAKAASVIAAILGFCGLATAACAGALPASLQEVAHHVIGAPAIPAPPARPARHHGTHPRCAACGIVKFTWAPSPVPHTQAAAPAHPRRPQPGTTRRPARHRGGHSAPTPGHSHPPGGYRRHRSGHPGHHRHHAHHHRWPGHVHTSPVHHRHSRRPGHHRAWHGHGELIRQHG